MPPGIDPGKARSISGSSISKGEISVVLAKLPTSPLGIGTDEEFRISAAEKLPSSFRLENRLQRHAPGQLCGIPFGQIRCLWGEHGRITDIDYVELDGAITWAIYQPAEAWRVEELIFLLGRETHGGVGRITLI